MNQTQLVQFVAEREELPITTVNQIMQALLDATATALSAGDSVNIRRFGKFEPRTRKPVTRQNPATGEDIHVPAKQTVAFIPSPVLKDRLNGDGETDLELVEAAV